MPEMRAETVRQAQREGILAEEDVTDPYELTSMSAPATREPERPSDGEPHLVTERAERLRTGPHLQRHESGGQ